MVMVMGRVRVRVRVTVAVTILVTARVSLWLGLELGLVGLGITDRGGCICTCVRFLLSSTSHCYLMLP